MRLFTALLFLLLAYIIAAIVFWGISLEKQNSQYYAQQISMLNSKVDSLQRPADYNRQLSALKHNRAMHTSQYIGEGATFLIVILIGAVVVYTSFVRSIMLSRQQNNFMLAVTHELKSPIAAMKLNLQTLEKHQLDEGKRKLLVDRCIGESDRLNDLCNNMLLASQIEGRQYKMAREPFDLSDLLEDMVEGYASRYPRKFEQDILPGCRISGDKIMLQMAISNLLENAVKYTPADKPISITLNKKNDQLVLGIADQGAGIPDNEKKKIFNKFYRIGNEESRKSKGTGLGLYLTNKIVMQHKGRITVKNNTPSGAVFEVCLPA